LSHFAKTRQDRIAQFHQLAFHRVGKRRQHLSESEGTD
jgi:hypothetical protein